MVSISAHSARYILVVGLLLAIVAPVLASQNGQRQTDRDTPVHVRDIQLVDQNGTGFSLSEFDDQPVMVNFVFTGCRTYCPVQNGTLMMLYDELVEREPKRDFKFISITLTPAFDGPREMKAYSERFSEGRDNWIFASGHPDHVQNILEQIELDVFVGERPQLDIFHETDVFVFQPFTDAAERFEGIPLDHDGLLQSMTEK